MKAISDMTYAEIIEAVLKAKGIRVSKDATGYGYIQFDQDERLQRQQSNRGGDGEQDKKWRLPPSPVSKNHP